MRIRPLALALSLVCCAGPGAPDYTPPDAATLLKARPYLLHGPTNGSPAPLVVALHGYGGSGAEIGDDLQLTALAAAQGFWLALPDGTVGYNGGSFWNATTTGYPPFDAPYLAAVIGDVVKQHAIDPKRIYVVGYSIGAFMAHRLACDLSPQIAAIVSVAGAVTQVPALCVTTSPVSVLEVHGDDDQVITYDGSPFVGDPPRKSSPSAHDTIATWARNDHCTGAVAPTSQTLDLDSKLPGAETSVEAYAGCPASVSVELWTIHGGQHQPDLQPDFGATIYGFLAAHPKP